MLQLTAAQLDDFGRNGYLVIPSAIPSQILSSASRAIDDVIKSSSPGTEIRGPRNFFLELEHSPPLRALFSEGLLLAYGEQLTAQGLLEMPWQIQVALNIPPFPHRPAMPHIDGFPPESDGRPGTFTMLVGVLMSEQQDEDHGNLWVWPGTHLLNARYFRTHGADSFFEARGYPPIELPEPIQIRGRTGDVLLAHYLLGHNIGGNTSSGVRRAAYFRVKAKGHDERWREILQDPFLEYDAIRNKPE